MYADVSVIQYLDFARGVIPVHYLHEEYLPNVKETKWEKIPGAWREGENPDLFKIKSTDVEYCFLQTFNKNSSIALRVIPLRDKPNQEIYDYYKITFSELRICPMPSVSNMTIISAHAQ